jgi:hypothetical protein
MQVPDQELVCRAFDSVLSDLEDDLGDLPTWSTDKKRTIAKQILQVAQAGFNQRGSGVAAEMNRVSAHGGALLSLYLELQTLPGDKSRKAAALIDEWRRAR